MDQAAEMASIPLLCNICAKQRKFSDISHLLTHVGSKGHLSHYFKLQVRSRQDPAARKQLVAYDQWYEAHEVERLLSERLTLKESKKPNPKRKLEKPLDTVPQKQETNILSSKLRGGDFTDEDVLDPQLSLQYVKEQRPRFNAGSIPPAELTSNHRVHAPRMHLWPTGRDRKQEMAQPLDQLSIPSIESEHGAGSDSESHFSSLSISNHTKSHCPDLLAAFNLQDAMVFDSGPSHAARPADDDDVGSSPYEEIEDLDPVSEGTKLKGVFWPGMNIFDSATPEMRRKRNQKKDGSVLEKMMISAAEVEPTELIFTPEGSLKKQRRISGMVEDSSPVKEESPKPKRRRSNSKRSTLTEISGNFPRLPKLQRGTHLGHTVKRPRIIEAGELSRRALADLDNQSASNTRSKGCRPMLTKDEDTEWSLTLGDAGHKKQAGFAIFQDPEHAEVTTDSVSQAPAQTFGQTPCQGHSLQSFGHPGGLSLLSSEFRLPSKGVRNSAGGPAFEQAQKAIPSSFRPFLAPPSGKDNKENVGPVANQLEPNDHQANSACAGQKGQHYFSIEEAHPPHFFHTLPCDVDFGAFADADPYESLPNQFPYNFQQLQPQQNNNQPSSEFHPFTSPYRRVSGSDSSNASYRRHHSYTNLGENENEHMLFGEMMD